MLLACARGGSPPSPAPTEAAPAQVEQAAAMPDAAPAGPDATAAPSTPVAFTLAAEMPAGRVVRLHRLPSGVAVHESGERDWRLLVAQAGGPLLELEALRQAPERHRPFEALFVGGAGDEVWISLSDTEHFPSFFFTTLRISRGTVKRVQGKWYRALASLESGDVVALPTREIPTYLRDSRPQALERVSGARSDVPAIPKPLRLYDVEILPSGRIHALGSRLVGDESTLLAWISAPGAPPRTLPLPPEVGTNQPALVRGGRTFLASVEGEGLWITERDGALVAVRARAPFGSAVVGPDGDVWFAEHDPVAGPRLLRAQLDPALGVPREPSSVPLPSASDLAAAGARTCRAIESVDGIAPVADTTWLAVSCTGDAQAVLHLPRGARSAEPERSTGSRTAGERTSGGPASGEADAARP